MTTSVCVFCSSSEAVGDTRRRLARELGGAIAGAGWSLVYGGGSVGLMGEVAEAALAAGARVVGVIPQRLAEQEIALHRVTELVTTETLRERKHVMDERADAFVVLPGGLGTLEELVEVMTLKQLGYHDRAIVLLDADGYWQPFLELLDRMVAQRLAHPWIRELVTVVHDVPAAIAALRSYTPPPVRPLAPVPAEVLEAAPPE